MISAMSATVQTQSATLATVAASATTGVIFAANGNRKGLVVYNEGSTVLYLAFAATATTSAYTVQVPATTGIWTYDPTSGYGGVISGIWAGSPTGNARTTAW